MDKKEIEINISNVLQNNRQAASYAGAMLGKAYTVVESRDCWQGGSEGFENDKKLAVTPGVAMLITNRSPRKYVLRTQDIIGAQVHQNKLTGEVGIAINLRPDGTYDLFLPLNGKNPVVVEKPMEDAISDALTGEGENFFLDAEKVADIINAANKNEVKSIDALIASLSKMKQNIQGAIVENDKKAAEIAKEWSDSKLAGIDIKTVLGGGAPATVTVHTSTEE
jgi:hypothetical protein